MNEISLVNGVVIAESIGQVENQDYIEIQLQNGLVIMITGSAGGNLKLGIKLDA